MPRGQKTCKNCGATCGPRSFTCPKCGAGFTIKGVQQQQAAPTTTSVDKPATSEFDPFKYIEDTEYPMGKLRHYGPEFKVWASLDRMFHIRYYTHFDGVDLCETKNFVLVKNDGNFSPISRHKNLAAAVRRMLKESKNEC